MRYTAVFFDLDGTLLDTSAGVIKAIDYTVDMYRLPKLPDEVKLSFIGPPIQDSFQRYYALSKEQAWKMATTWRDVYKALFLLEAKPYDGIYEALHAIRGCGLKTGVATNKRADYTIKLLEHFQFTRLFDFIAGTDVEGRLKKSDLILICMEKLGIPNAKRCLMVGDTTNDLEAAKKAGVDFLGVTYGFGFKEETASLNINYIEAVNTPDDIREFIVDILNKQDRST